jgi:hypothetical protein
METALPTAKNARRRTAPQAIDAECYCWALERVAGIGRYPAWFAPRSDHAAGLLTDLRFRAQFPGMVDPAHRSADDTPLTKWSVSLFVLGFGAALVVTTGQLLGLW